MYETWINVYCWADLSVGTEKTHLNSASTTKFRMTTNLPPFLFPFYAQQMKTKADTLLQIKPRNQRGDGTTPPPPTTTSINPSSVLPAHNLFLTTKTWRNELLDGHPRCTGADSLLRLVMLWGFGSPPVVEIESLYAPVCVTRWTSWSNSLGCLLLKTQNWKWHLRRIRMRSGPCQTQR